MTNREPTPADVVLVAIDIAKLRNDVLIELPDSVRRKRLTVLNTRAEHDRFLELLGNLKRPVLAGFEATGNYHRPLAFRLLQAGIGLRLVSSVALARTREALHNGWDDRLGQRGFVGTYFRLTALRCARLANNRARPTLRHGELRAHVVHARSLAGRAQY
jgi:transposase